MKISVPPEQWKLFERLPRKDRPPFSEVAAVQTFKLMGWATATGGLYLLQERSGSVGLMVIPYLLWLLIVWDMTAKLGWEPDVERTDSTLHLIVTKRWGFKLFFVLLLASFTAWAVIFWIAPLIYKHGLANL
jgi:hypothetical protein